MITAHFPFFSIIKDDHTIERQYILLFPKTAIGEVPHS